MLQLYKFTHILIYLVQSLYKIFLEYKHVYTLCRGKINRILVFLVLVLMGGHKILVLNPHQNLTRKREVKNVILQNLEGHSRVC